MKPNEQFLMQPKTFWAYVRSISQKLGYTVKKGALKGSIKIPSLEEMADALIGLELDAATVRTPAGAPTELGTRLMDYFSHRAGALNVEMPNQLMNADEAREAYDHLKTLRTYTCPFPQNKQKGLMRAPAYLTCMVNMIVETEIGEAACNFDRSNVGQKSRRRISQSRKPLCNLGSERVLLHNQLWEPNRGWCLRNDARRHGVGRTYHQRKYPRQALPDD